MTGSNTFYRNSKTSSSGFTLVELVVTLAIAAILIVMSTSFGNVYQNNQISSYAQDLMTALQFARSEAVTRSTRVTVCKRDATDPQKCATTGDWSNGWLVFVDEDNNATVKNPTKDILRVHEPLKNKYTLYGAGHDIDSYVSFIATGFPRQTSNGMQSGSLVLCDWRGYKKYARKIVVGLAGRMRIVQGGDANDTSGPTTCPSS